MGEIVCIAVTFPASPPRSNVNSANSITATSPCANLHPWEGSVEYGI